MTKSPISVHSSSDEEDEFEEVDIPGSNVGSSAPGTPGSVATGADGADTTVDVSAVSESESEEEADGEEQVIRLELGGETAEEKAKKLAWAMRK